jgi:hypothetical protein
MRMFDLSLTVTVSSLGSGRFVGRRWVRLEEGVVGVLLLVLLAHFPVIKEEVHFDGSE